MQINISSHKEVAKNLPLVAQLLWGHHPQRRVVTLYMEDFSVMGNNQLPLNRFFSRFMLRMAFLR